MTLFETFYGQHYSGRKLLWQWNLARGDLRLTYLDRPYEIQVGLYQMVVLLLFNTTTALAVRDIIDQSGLTEADVVRSIKVRINGAQEVSPVRVRETGLLIL